MLVLKKFFVFFIEKTFFSTWRYFRFLFNRFVFLFSFFFCCCFLASRLIIWINFSSFFWFNNGCFQDSLFYFVIFFKLFKSIFEIQFIYFFIRSISLLITSHLLLISCDFIIDILYPLIDIIIIFLFILILLMLMIFFYWFFKLRLLLAILSFFHYLTAFKLVRFSQLIWLIIKVFEVFFRCMIAIFVLKFMKSINSLRLL